MGKIRILPDILASKIAAGEVVERPASVVKELIENSLDAGSRRIAVEVEVGGKRLIHVLDDGEGMTRDDALLAFERHSTSKLKTVDDLEGIATLGFRGEALPSIASVTKLVLRTKTQAEEVGTEIEIEGGKIKNVRDCAWNQGTDVHIRDLFFNIPARRKFLKSDTTELFHITNLVTHYALAYPKTGFSLAHEGRKLIEVTPVETLRDRAYQAFGADFLSNLIELDHSQETVRVFGFASKPTSARTNKEAQYFFVNGRFVKDRVIGYALSESYRAIIPSGTYPAAILFIVVPPQDVDVNVHPAKTEIRFRRPNVVQSAIIEAIQKAISTAKPVFEMRKPEPPSGFIGRSRIDVMLPRRATTEAFRLQSPEMRPTRPPIQSPLQLGFPGREEPRAPQSQPPSVAEPVETKVESTRMSTAERVEISPQCLNRPTLSLPAELLGVSRLYPLGQLRDSFIISTSSEGLLLIDQHAAHERILFERFRKAVSEGSVATQPLLVPEIIELTPAQTATFDSLKDELQAIGFELGELSGRSLSVTALPADIPSGEAHALILEVLEIAEMEKRSLTVEKLRDRIAASMACRAAIKVNMPLTDQTMSWLVEELFKTAAPSNCPHGRPTVVKMTIREIERLFQR